MTRIKIPSSVQEAVDSLGGLEALLTAKQWTRAAIVAAFVRLDNKPGPKRSADSSRSLTPAGFAKLGINGLKSKDTVQLYAEAWAAAVADGKAQPVEPGKSVVLPDAPWPYEPKNARLYREAHPEEMAKIERTAAEHDVSPNTVIQVVNTPAAVAAAIEADPKIAGEAARSLTKLHNERVRRAERKAETDPIPAKIDSRVALLDLARALSTFNRDTGDVLRRVGDLPDIDRTLLTEALERAEITLAAVRRFVETGKSDLDAGIEAILSEAR